MVKKWQNDVEHKKLDNLENLHLKIVTVKLFIWPFSSLVITKCEMFNRVLFNSLSSRMHTYSRLVTKSRECGLANAAWQLA